MQKESPFCVQFAEGMNNVLQIVSTMAVRLSGGLPTLIDVVYTLTNKT